MNYQKHRSIYGTNQWICDLSSICTSSDSSTAVTVHISKDAINKVFVNGKKISSPTVSVRIDNSNKIAHVYVDETCTSSTAIKIQNGSNYVEVAYNPNIASVSKPEYPSVDKLCDFNASYALLRTNPKLTGNVKVVVDSDSNIYLDTFKTSRTLSSTRYRHVSVNPDEYYGKHISKTFGDVNTSDFYKVEDECYGLFSAAKDYSKQYYTTYNSGVRTNTDSLYMESFSYFAPLVVNSILPDFFLLFKVPVSSSFETKSESDKIAHFLKNGELVKSFDLRDGTKVGRYIRKVLEQSNKLCGDVFAAYDNDNMNKFNGISVDRGVIASIFESAKKQMVCTNQVALNTFLTEGFERNRVVSKNIMNFEFMFDDPGAKQFSVNSYFGLYVKMNENDDTFSCIGYDEDSMRYEYDSSVNDFPSDTDLSKDSSFGSIIYGYTTPTEFVRLRTPLSVSSDNEKYKMKPYKSVLTSNIHHNSNTAGGSYITFSIEEPLCIGNNIKVVSVDKKEILEVVYSNTNDGFDDDGISEVVINRLYTNTGDDYTVYRVSVLGSTEDDVNSNAMDQELILDSQVDILYKAFLKIGTKYDSDFSDGYNPNQTNYNYIFKKLDDRTISILVKDSADCVFERICPEYTLDTDDYISTYESDSLKFFNALYPDKSYLMMDSNVWKSKKYCYLYPTDFEMCGSRVAYIVRFVSFDANADYTIDSSLLNTLDNKHLVYKVSDTDYAELDRMHIDNIIIKDDIEITSKEAFCFLAYNGKYMVNVVSPYYTNNTIDFYSLYPINVGVCSILQLKDFDFSVMDGVSNLSSAGIKKIDANDLTFLGKYTGTDNYMKKKLLNVTEERIINYIDLYDDGTVHTDVTGGLTLGVTNKYTKALVNDNVIRSSVSLTSPYSCKWSGLSTDDSGDFIRVMSHYKDLVDSSSFFIPYAGEYNTNLGYEVVPSKNIAKYPERKYIAKSVNSADPIHKCLIRTSILNGDRRISDIVYDSAEHAPKFSAVSKSGDNAIEFISGGVKFRILSNDTNVVDTNKYANYSAIFISTPEPNNNNNRSVELLVDEENKEMAIIWYQAINGLKYGETNASNTSCIFYDSPIRNCDIRGNRLYVDNRDNRTFDSFAPGTKMILASVSMDDEYLYPDNNVVFIGTIDESTDNEHIVLNNITMYANGSIISNPSKSDIYTNANYHDDVTIAYIVDASLNGTPIKHRTFSDLKVDCTNAALYIRKSDGGKDYSSMDGAFSINIMDPLSYSGLEQGPNGKYATVNYGVAMPCYVTPLYKDMLKFDYCCEESIYDNFKKNFDGANIAVSGIKTIDQVWINKYSDENQFCINDKVNRFSIDCIQGVSVMDNSWSSSKYRKYTTYNDISEKVVTVAGYSTGLEINTFLGSRGIEMKNDDGAIELDSWKNTHIDSIKKCIKLSITDTLINLIRQSDGFKQSWASFGINGESYKTSYIKNSILNLININNKGTLKLYRNEDEKKGLTLSNYKNTENVSTLVEVTNFKNELKYENGKYYMYIYVDESYEYFAKYTISI